LYIPAGVEDEPGVAVGITVKERVQAEQDTENDPRCGQENLAELGQRGLGCQIKEERAERKGRQGQQHKMKGPGRSAKSLYPENGQRDERDGIAMPP
jgi:hypothetical protein